MGVKDTDWIKDGVVVGKDSPFTKGCIVFHPGGKTKYGTDLPKGLYIFDSFEKDDGKIGNDWATCYITKKVNSGFHWYMDCSTLTYIMSKDDAKKFGVDVNEDFG